MHTDNTLGFQSVFIRVHPWPDFFLTFSGSASLAPGPWPPAPVFQGPEARS
jgi:hypothetical protein